MSKCWCGRELNTAGNCPVHVYGYGLIDLGSRIEELEAENRQLREKLTDATGRGLLWDPVGALVRLGFIDERYADDARKALEGNAKYLDNENKTYP